MSSHYHTDTATDIVSLTALHLSAAVGPDHWQRTRPQPIQLSLHLHLTPLYLDVPGQSDDVRDSLHYGHLAKAVERRVVSRAEQGYTSATALIEDVTDAAFSFVREAVVVAARGGSDSKGAEAVGGVVQAVRVVLALPKQILLASGFEVELTTLASDWIARSVGSGTGSRAGAIVRVTDLILPVIIGVNPPERLAKQRVVTNLVFLETACNTDSEGGDVDYPAVIQQIATASHPCFLRRTLSDNR